MDKELFLARLRKYIEETEGVSTASLAVRAGMANSTIRRWFDGTAAPTFSSAQKVLNVIGQTYEEFMGDLTDPSDDISDLWRQLTPEERRHLRASARAWIADRRGEDS